jgi:hypothetical protein
VVPDTRCTTTLPGVSGAGNAPCAEGDALRVPVGVGVPLRVLDGDALSDGELVGDAVCQARERYYEAHGIADYMFRLGPGEVVDATLRGCRARYINHCCDPNCFAVITLPEAGGGGGGGGAVGAGVGGEPALGPVAPWLADAPVPHAPAAEAAAVAVTATTASAAAAQPGSGRKVYVYALRRIAPGEELTYDYAFSPAERRVPCRCGAANCRGTINAA